MADIFSRLNELNLYLQGTEGINIFAVYDKTRSFVKKLVLWKNCLNNQNYDCFETLQTFITEIEAKVDDDVINEISEHLNKSKESFKFYFLEEMNAMQQRRWIMNPFQPAMTTGISTKADEELSDLSENSSLEMNFNSRKLVQFWVSLQTP